MTGPIVSRRTVLAGFAGAAVAGLVARPLGAALTETTGPYGALATTPDALGFLLPQGFTAREVARSGEVVPGTSYTWHTFPDGGAVFPDGEGWIYVSNSELTPGGGVGALRFDATGNVVDAYSICSGTAQNCAGGATPWGTWLSCEEHEGGLVWECYPTGATPAVARPALGAFVHEAAAVDPDGEIVYLTEDHPEGLFYRFVPTAWPDLTAGALEVAAVDAAGNVDWLPVPDPSAATQPTREQVPGATVFIGGEGAWYLDGTVLFTTKGDGRVWELDIAADHLGVFYDPLVDPAVLEGPDNLTVTSFDDVYVCEDTGSAQQVVMITVEGQIAPLLQLVGHDGSELAGIAFDPSGTRMYISSQRGNGGPGVTYEISGPFRQVAPEPSTTAAAAPPPTVADEDDGFSVNPAIGLGVALLGGAAALAWRLRTRPRDDAAAPPTGTADRPDGAA